MNKIIFIVVLLSVNFSVSAAEVEFCTADHVLGKNDSISCSGKRTDIQTMYKKGWKIKIMNTITTSSITGRETYIVFEK